MACHKQIVIDSKLLAARIKCANDFEKRLRRIAFSEEHILYYKSNFEIAISEIQTPSEMRKKLTEWTSTMKNSKTTSVSKKSKAKTPEEKPKQRINFEIIEVLSEDEEK